MMNLPNPNVYTIISEFQPLCVTEQYDAFLEKCLKPYGIDRANATENQHRVCVSYIGPDQTGSDIEEFAIDGQYAFSIRRTRRIDLSTMTGMYLYECFVKGETDEST